MNNNVKKFGNDIWNWLNGPEDEDSGNMSYFQRSAVMNSGQAQNRQNQAQQQLYYDSPISPLDKERFDFSSSGKEKRDSRIPLKRVSVDEEELEDYDFYSSDHLDKIFDVVIEIQEEYDKKRKEEFMKFQQSQKANQEKVPKALLNPEVQRQIKKQKVYKPYFLVTLTVLQVVIMILEMAVNWAKLGSPIDLNSENFNIMIGPSTSVSLLLYCFNILISIKFFLYIIYINYCQ